ncbi:hypothetical protein BS78_03G185800 [Paspalum vaginatum]|nr:hypothetical protein BS78_03G185800 [Paspalum vaginatum]
MSPRPAGDGCAPVRLHPAERAPVCTLSPPRRGAARAVLLLSPAPGGNCAPALPRPAPLAPSSVVLAAAAAPPSSHRRRTRILLLPRPADDASDARGPSSRQRRAPCPPAGASRPHPRGPVLPRRHPRARPRLESGTAAATVPVAKSIRCVPRERDALLAFKAGLTDPDNYLSSWQGEDCCQWKGIRCSNHTGHVTELQLQSLHGFRGGQMSPSLLGLKNLRTLDLRGNNFSGAPIPDFIGGLNNLRNNPLRTTAANNQQSIYVHRQSWTLWASSCQQLLHE